jgi:large subunit ribosomal protein L21
VYAIVRTGGKQYRVEAGSTIYVERLEAPVGQKVTFEEVLLVGGEGEARVGKPTVSGVAVEAQIVASGKHRKVTHFRKKKEGWTKKRGHRQPYTELVITEIRA